MAQPPAAAERVFTATVDAEGRLIIPPSEVADLHLTPGEPVEVRGQVRRVEPAAATQPPATDKRPDSELSFGEFLDRYAGSATGGMTTDEVMAMTRGED